MLRSDCFFSSIVNDSGFAFHDFQGLNNVDLVESIKCFTRKFPLGIMEVVEIESICPVI